MPVQDDSDEITSSLVEHMRDRLVYLNRTGSYGCCGNPAIRKRVPTSSFSERRRRKKKQNNMLKKRKNNLGPFSDGTAPVRFVCSDFVRAMTVPFDFFFLSGTKKV